MLTNSLNVIELEATNIDMTASVKPTNTTIQETLTEREGSKTVAQPKAMSPNNNATVDQNRIEPMIWLLSSIDPWSLLSCLFRK